MECPHESRTRHIYRVDPLTPVDSDRRGVPRSLVLYGWVMCLIGVPGGNMLRLSPRLFREVPIVV